MTAKHILLLIVLFVAVLVLTVVIRSGIGGSANFSPVPNTTPIHTQTPTPTPDPKRPITLLLLGYGGGKHEGGLLTDTMILAVIQPKKQTITLIPIPRDLWIELPTTHNTMLPSKINAAFAIGTDTKNYPDKPEQFTGSLGGIHMASYVVERISGIKPDATLAVNFDGFIGSVDALDGLDVNAANSLIDPFYPIAGEENNMCGIDEDEAKQRESTASGFILEELYTCRFETLSFEPGIQHMDGTTALKYVRSRHAYDGGGDFDRSRRQKEVLSAMKEKIISLGFITKASSYFTAWRGNILTDLTLAKVADLVDRTGNPEGYTFQSISLTTDTILTEDKSPDGQYILNPAQGQFEWSGIQEYIMSKL